MSLKSSIDKILFSYQTNFYNVIFKTPKSNLKCIFKVKINDAKNIALADEGVNSERLRVYKLFLDLFSLLNVSINKFFIYKDDLTINSLLYLEYGDKTITFDLNFIDSIIISSLSSTPLYIDKNLFVDIPIKNKNSISTNYIDDKNLSKLKKILKDLISNEEYESAAKIRDKINKISNF